MNDWQKIKYYDSLFSSGKLLIKGATLKWVKQHNINYKNMTVNKYFDILIQMANTRLTNRGYKEFKDRLWSEVNWSYEILNVGQVLKLKNKRFTGNQYVVTRLDSRGFDVYNRRKPQYRFKDLDYDSIDKILVFNL